MGCSKPQRGGFMYCLDPLTSGISVNLLESLFIDIVVISRLLSSHVYCAPLLAMASHAEGTTATSMGMHVEDMDLPPLFASFAIDGLPPFHQSVHLDEAEAELAKIVARWNIPSFHDYCQLSLFAASVMQGSAISARRLVDTALEYAVVFVTDDLFFDSPNHDLLEAYGVPRGERESIEGIQEFLDRLNGIFSSPEPPDGSSKIESIVWELGHDMRELSSRDWFRYNAKTVVEFYQSSTDSFGHIFAGNDVVHLKDLDSYSRMRMDNAAAPMVLSLTELTNNDYLPEDLRCQAWAKEVIKAASSHIMAVNDIYSYHKESVQEKLPINLITVLMKTEGMSLAQAVRWSIELGNSNARTIFDLEAQLMASGSRVNDSSQPVGDVTDTSTTAAKSNPFEGMCSARKSDVARFLQGIKETISGNLYYHCLHKRYRHPNSTFPELRDVNHREAQTSDLLLVSEYGRLKVIADPAPEASPLVAT